jgi:hypothetical protein
MFSHVVIFWTKPENPNAANELIRRGQQVLKRSRVSSIFTSAEMATSQRPVVDQTYQVALNLVFPTRKRRTITRSIAARRVCGKAFKPNCARVVVYDFE